MKELFDPVQADSIRRRTLALRPDRAPEWGSIPVTRMLNHCTAGIEMALGTLPVKRSRFPFNVIGLAIKPLVFRDDTPMRRNAPTAPELFSHGEGQLNFEVERARLLAAIDGFAQGGPAGCLSSFHPFFGTLTPRQWSILMYKHLDHHLRQFGA